MSTLMAVREFWISVCFNMKKRPSDLKADLMADLKDEVKELLKNTLVTESSVNVWGQFETALRGLDRSALLAIRTYLSGGSYGDVSKRLDISEQESRDLVAQAKRQLVEKLRRRCKVRQ